MATFIIAGIVVVPMILLLADLLVGRDRLTSPSPAGPARRPTR